MEYNTVYDSGTHTHSIQSDDNQTYSKAPVKTKEPSDKSDNASGKSIDPPPPLTPASFQETLTPTDTYRPLRFDVKPDVNESPYVSGHVRNPNYGGFTPLAMHEGNDVGAILNQHLKPGAGGTINIQTLNIYHNDPGVYYQNVKPPNPCTPHEYAYPMDPTRDSANNNIYMKIPQTKEAKSQKIPVEQETSSDESRRDTNSDSSQETLPTRTSENTEKILSGVTQAQGELAEGLAKLLMSVRQSSNDTSPVIEVQLRMKDTSQYWQGELKCPLPTSASSVSSSSSNQELEQNVTEEINDQTEEDYQQKGRLSNSRQSANELKETPQKFQVIRSSQTSMPDEDFDSKDTKNTPHGAVENPFYMQVPSRVPQGSTVSLVDEPNWLLAQGWRNSKGYPVRNGHEGFNQDISRWSQGMVSQSAPDVRVDMTRSPFPSPKKRHFLKRDRDHQCVVDGLFTIHEKVAIENARASLEQYGQEGQWMVTYAVDQPLQSHVLHVHHLGAVNTFPVIKTGDKLSICAKKKKSCLCKLIKHYSKEPLPVINTKLSLPFQKPSPCRMEMSHL